jgi:acetyl esterase/lipase
LKEACDSLKWVLEYSNSPSLDPIWVAIVGDSVGGKLVTIVTMLG